MATTIARDDEGYLTQGVTFSAKIDNYVVTLGLNAADVAQVKTDFEWFGYQFLAAKKSREYAQAVTAFKDSQRYGIDNQVLPAFPAMPVLGTQPVNPTFAGAQGRFATLIQQIVNNPKYSKVIGEDLAIEAPEAPFNPELGQPLLKPGYSTSGHPELKWKKGKFQGIEVMIDRADGKGWVYLDKDYNPDFTDKITPLPAPGASAVWKYRAIYLYKGEQAGQWSETVSVTVHGIS